MAITLIDKIKPKNNGKFPLVDAEDVLMPDGSRLSDTEMGKPGKDGISATHSWSGTTLTITSASGTSSADLKGDKGDDYTLTDADKQEIAEIAQAMVDVGSGSSIVVDSAFNAESENPVMNKTITAAMGQALEAIGAIQQDITNLQNSALPTVTTEDNDKFLQVVDGKWSAVNATAQVSAIVANYVNTMFVPLTQEEYDALATVDPSKYYMIVGDSQ